MFSIDTLIFFLSSFLTLLLSSYAASTMTLQQILAVLLLVLLLLLNRRLPFTRSFSIENRSYRFVLLFISAFFVQLLVISTGGFYSIFLILLHIFTLGTSFLLNLRSSISFLVFSLFILLAHVFLNQLMWLRFQEDPWSLVLYLTSFIVVIPLAQLLMRSYHLNEVISKALASQIAMLELREKSILGSLSELVLVTNKSLHILSANEVVERTLGLLIGEILQQPFLDTLVLKDKTGKRATLASLAIDKALTDKATHVIEGFFLQTKAAKPIEVVIQVHPVADLEGEISQIAFVIKSAKGGEQHQLHSYLEQARMRHRALIENVANLPQLRRQMELYSKIEDDLITALEIEDHPISPTVTNEDVVLFCNRVISAKQNFAKSLGVTLTFTNPPSNNSAFFLPIDAKWLDLILRKLLDMAILLASKEEKPNVELRLPLAKTIREVVITASCPNISEKALSALFSQYYGDLGAKTNLILGSGLEGFIAKTVAVQLHLHLSARLENNRLTFSLGLR